MPSSSVIAVRGGTDSILTVAFADALAVGAEDLALERERAVRIDDRAIHFGASDRSARGGRCGSPAVRLLGRVVTSPRARCRDRGRRVAGLGAAIAKPEEPDGDGGDEEGERVHRSACDSSMLRCARQRARIMRTMSQARKGCDHMRLTIGPAETEPASLTYSGRNTSVAFTAMLLREKPLTGSTFAARLVLQDDDARAPQLERVFACS